MHEITSPKPIGYGDVHLNDSSGRALFTADAHRSDGKRFIVTADEKLTAFLELESVTWTDRD